LFSVFVFPADKIIQRAPKEGSKVTLRGQLQHHLCGSRTAERARTMPSLFPASPSNISRRRARSLARSLALCCHDIFMPGNHGLRLQLFFHNLPRGCFVKNYTQLRAPRAMPAGLAGYARTKGKRREKIPALLLGRKAVSLFDALLGNAWQGR
jgi:hypothetical protein